MWILLLACSAPDDTFEKEAPPTLDVSFTDVSADIPADTGTGTFILRFTATYASDDGVTTTARAIGVRAQDDQGADLHVFAIGDDTEHPLPATVDYTVEDGLPAGITCDTALNLQLEVVTDTASVTAPFPPVVVVCEG